MCEDYPCCGHTDGLGCNWVSPNEIQPCAVCIEARAFNPYHTTWAGDCPTLRRKAIESVPAGAICDCGEDAEIMYGAEAVCASCHDEAISYDNEMSDIYER